MHNIYPFGPVFKPLSFDYSMPEWADPDELLGGKGAKLRAMSELGLDVPSGLTIPTTACMEYLGLPEHKKAPFIFGYAQRVYQYFNGLFEKDVFPLVSVRSGARVSMPGMMDTILNVGILRKSLPYWECVLGKTYAWDCYRRFIQMYSNVVGGISTLHFEAAMTKVCKSYGVASEQELSMGGYVELVNVFENLAAEKMNIDFEEVEVLTLLKDSIAAVFNSWNTVRAKTYRKIHNIPDSWGTAVNIQLMVFGNLGDTSCSGVVFSRNPETGHGGLYGDFLVNAQGEDVVAGIRDPQTISEMADWDSDVFKQLQLIANNLEIHFKDMQDIEFTVQSGKLYILQTRNAKRSVVANFKVLSKLMEDGVLTWEDCRKKLNVAMLLEATKLQIDPQYIPEEPFVTGCAAGGGLVSGVIVFNFDQAIDCGDTPCILVAMETTPEDIGSINASVGILTVTGGKTSHAALVARGMGKACVVGAVGLDISTLNYGAWITIDGDTGRVWKGKLPLVSLDIPEVKNLVERTLDGIEYIPLGTSYKDAFKGKVMLPFKYFGAANFDTWLKAINEAVINGLVVYVSTDLGYTEDDLTVATLMCQAKTNPNVQLDVYKLLADAGLSGKVHLWSGDSVDAIENLTLDKFLMGGVTHPLSESTILKVFGSVAAYNTIRGMMENLKLFKGVPLVKHTMELLDKFWGDK